MSSADFVVLLPSLAAVFLFVVAGVWIALTFAKHLSKIERWIIVWYVYDALTHLIMEGGFVFMSLTGTVATSNFWMAPLWKEYGNADTRWLHSDSCIVSMEIVTVFFDGFACLVVIYAMLKNKPYRHFWQIILCVCELYGGFMTFLPEIITGSHNLNTSDIVYNLLYLWFFNGIWVVIPVLLLWQSYLALCVPPVKKYR